MIIPSPTQPLESLDLHICPSFAKMLKKVPVKQRPEVQRLVLRLISNSELHDYCADKASRHALNWTIRHFRGIHTLCIYDSSSVTTPSRFTIIKSLVPADLPELEALILKRSYRKRIPDLLNLLPDATAVSNKCSKPIL